MWNLNSFIDYFIMIDFRNIQSTDLLPSQLHGYQCEINQTHLYLLDLSKKKQLIFVLISE